MKLIVGAFGVLAVATGMALLCAPLAAAARYSGTTVLLFTVPLLALYPLVNVMTSGRQR